ncbi:hypothetical protein BKA56DRAFT_682702 [Ilyonectria sp. MPI-CAGE-AT-0026]|nr:hypothetical protein BKA56DRAFT_682702 [Ilyonectria sp. MPI-CAGE-AT-0026]
MSTNVPSQCAAPSAEGFGGQLLVPNEDGRWADVFKSLEAHGVAVLGGRDGNVEIAGCLTRGSNSYYTVRAGFGRHSIVSIQIVLANGSIIKANKDSHSDPKALKGRSGNFGIVTRFDRAAFPAGNVWGGICTTELSQAEAITNTMVNFTDNYDKNPEAA